MKGDVLNDFWHGSQQHAHDAPLRVTCVREQYGHDEQQLREFAATSATPLLHEEEMIRIDDLVSHHFGIEQEEGKFKGLMELPVSLSSKI